MSCNFTQASTFEFALYYTLMPLTICYSEISLHQLGKYSKAQTKILILHVDIHAQILPKHENVRTNLI